jgi:hypothetical protein
MAELEHDLRALGGELAFPQTPDLGARVRARLAEPRRGFLSARRRPLVLALGLALLALAIAFAVPPARSAILRFFHLGAVTVERVETLPPAQERPLLSGLGRSVPREQAEREAGFRMLLPPLEREPARLHVRGRMLSTVLDVPVGDTRRRVLLIELEGDQLGLSKKLAGRETLVQPVAVNGRSGMWLSGAQHVVLFEDAHGRVIQTATRFAGNVLVWLQGDRTLRLEGPLRLRDVLALAKSIR